MHTRYGFTPYQCDLLKVIVIILYNETAQDAILLQLQDYNKTGMDAVIKCIKTCSFVSVLKVPEHELLLSKHIFCKTYRLAKFYIYSL